VQHIHFVGVGGAGMSGIAQVLREQGFQVSGSDAADSQTLQQLGAMGIQTYVGHQAEQAEGADVVVASSAIAPDNAELRRAREQGVPVVPRAVMLAELMRARLGVAIAGTHGKTTTTALVVSILREAGMDPSFVIGGRLNSAAGGAHWGQGQAIVVEADESDASFKHLTPMLAVVTNIDADHMETYGHDTEQLRQAFVDFLHRMPFYGRAIVCSDDPGVQAVLPRLRCAVTTYGFENTAQWRAVDVQAKGLQMHFVLQRTGLHGQTLPDLPVVLNLPGRHNVLNALAALVVAQVLQVPDEAVLLALAAYAGVGRRFEQHGELPCEGVGQFTLIEDYGHHPVELAATLAAARGAYVGRRLVLCFQPHRYTRTRDCFQDFVRVLAQADRVLLSDVYGAGEPPIAGADGAALAQALRQSGVGTSSYVGAIGNMAQALQDLVQPGDVVLCMGAGSIGDVAAELVAKVSRAEEGAQA
jgi:UDP-N-acetylmuramate--alanine ligase